MGTDCSQCSCSDQKEIDDTTALSLEKKAKDPTKYNLNEKE